MIEEKIQEHILEALETEKGGVQIYQTALKCAVNDELKSEWEEYFEQTQNHVVILETVCRELGLDPDREVPGRKIVRLIGQSLVEAMETALQGGEPEAAEIVAAECVTHAETKDHMNWELIGLIAEKAKGKEKKVLQDAYNQVEDEEDEHLYHTRGWARELHIQAFGLRAVLPPPEEEKNVKTAIGAARAEKSRSKMTSKKK